MESITFGRWTVLSADTDYWLCRCACGVERRVRKFNLLAGGSNSCGCLMRERSAEQGRANRKHGHDGTPTYRCWVEMRRRCRKPHPESAKYYQGVTVCERWQSFANFLADMGERPSPKHSLDRYPNNSGNYEPGNVRWATMKEQANNRRARAKHDR